VNNAALVIAQFGNGWPYLDLWLSTVARQKMDVLFFTDYDFDAPPNVKIHKCSMDDIFDRAEKTYGLKFQNRYPYKLCDLKSFYGKIFEDELKDYEYWGYGDSDVVYGNLPTFGNLELYCAKHKRPDMALVRSAKPVGRWFIPGHFVMMRNDDRGRRIFEHLPTAKALLEESTNNYIDEWLVPTVLIHEYGLGAGGIEAQDYEYVKGFPIKLADGALYIGDKEYSYLHWYKEKSKVKTAGWRAMGASLNIQGCLS